jgi:hypothetical protein
MLRRTGNDNGEMSNVLMNAVTKKLGGDRPSVLQAALAAAVPGVAAAVVTYRVLRA